MAAYVRLVRNAEYENLGILHSIQQYCFVVMEGKLWRKAKPKSWVVTVIWKEICLAETLNDMWAKIMLFLSKIMLR